MKYYDIVVELNSRNEKEYPSCFVAVLIDDRGCCACLHKHGVRVRRNREREREGLLFTD